MKKTKFKPNIIAFFVFILAIFSLSHVFGELQKFFVVYIITNSDSVGLQKDQEILKKELEKLGHVVYEKHIDTDPQTNEQIADINIFVQFLKPSWFSFAKRNWLIPNPDFYTQPIELLQDIDLIICRTHESERIFQNLNQNTYYLGFTSQDNFENPIKKDPYSQKKIYSKRLGPYITPPISKTKKDYSKCLHVAGQSGLKGTTAIVKAWKNFPILPNLSVVIRIPQEPLIQDNVVWYSHKLQYEVLRFLQNHCGIHLCPSEIEGYGHYIGEAMSTEAVVITTDAPPMNEFITDKRCLVPYERSSFRCLGTTYYVSAEELARVIQNIMSLSEEERKEIGKNNREVYLRKTKEFIQNLENLMNSLEKV